jgi:REP element-mobilizing transposase RayT
MANTYTQIYIQIVFAVQGRQSLIRPQHNDELQKYMTGIISGYGQKLIAINNMPDHFHILVGQTPNVALSDLVRGIKASSSGFINDRRWVPGRFSWQEGFGAFSHAHSQLDAGHPIHSIPARASPAHNVPRRISRNFEEI